MRTDDTTLTRRPCVTAATSFHALRVLWSPDERVVGRVLRLTDEPLHIGRKPHQSGLAIADPLLSRHHGRIVRDDAQRYRYEDEGCRNPTQINGVPRSREVLASGDLLRLGDSFLRFGPVDLRAVGWEPPSGCPLRGASDALRQVLEQLARAAPGELTVLIQGETGTGKELVARELHRQSGRSGPFVAINCAAIPGHLVESELFGHKRGAFTGAVRDREGLLRSAEGGTVLLDEVGELPPEVQAKLLRVLEEREVRPVGGTRARSLSVRFVAATNQPLGAAAERGDFRPDLYARLRQWVIELPPLHERPEDLLPIVQHVLAEHGRGRAYELSGDAFEAMALHRWPFNVRELVSAVRRALDLLPTGGTIELHHLPQDLRPSEGAPPPLEPAAPLPARGAEPTARELEQLLAHHKGNVSAVAEHTGRKRAQVYRWLKRFGLSAPEFRCGTGAGA